MSTGTLGSRSRGRQRLRELWALLRGGELSPPRASLSVAVGLFIGSLPLYGLHLPLILAVCVPLRLSSVVAYLVANVSNPLVAPFLLTLEVEVGSLLLTGSHVPFDVEQARQTGFAGFVAQVALGSVVVGAALAAVGAAVAWRLAARRRGASELTAAIERTVARYRSAPRADRFYVAAKLRSDPVAAALTALEGSFGRVVDAGAGRGQLGLLLLELGRVSSLHGFDYDVRKVAVANLAAAGDAVFRVGDLRDELDAPLDTLLLVDVLHYLGRQDQDALLERACRSLTPGGRLILREADAGAGARGWLTRSAERIGATIGYNRAEILEFRASAELVAALEGLGMSVSVERHEDGPPLANSLLVATRPPQRSALEAPAHSSLKVIST